MPTEKTIVTVAIETIQARVAAGASLQEAARSLGRGFALRVLDRVGSWPSSEPELRALQQAFP